MVGIMGKVQMFEKLGKKQRRCYQPWYGLRTYTFLIGLGCHMTHEPSLFTFLSPLG